MAEYIIKVGEEGYEKPTVIQELVRCKDCIRFRPDDDVWGWCTVSGKMRCKDFCSYGVREDGEQHDKCRQV